MYKGNRTGGAWRKRFMVLMNGGMLYYFQNRKQWRAARKAGNLELYKPGVDVNSCVIDLPILPGDEPWPDRAKPINLVVDERVFWLAAGTYDAFHQWLVRLCHFTEQEPDDLLTDEYDETHGG